MELEEEKIIMAILTQKRCQITDLMSVLPSLAPAKIREMCQKMKGENLLTNENGKINSVFVLTEKGKKEAKRIKERKNLHKKFHF